MASSIKVPHEKRIAKQPYSKYYNNHFALSNGFFHWRYLQNKYLSLVQRVDCISKYRDKSFVLEDIGGEGKRNGFIKIRFRDKWISTVTN